MPSHPAIRLTRFILGLVALADLSLAAALVVVRSSYPNRQTAILVCALCLVGNALWAFTTAVGLAHRRHAARISLLIRAGIYAFVGILGAAVEIASLIQALRLSGGSYRVAYTTWALAAFFLLMAATGLSWLVYFSLRTTRALFVPTP